MGLYYHVACHDCKEQGMISKCTEEASERVHTNWTKKLHDGHNTQLSHDYDEDFLHEIYKYSKLSMDYLDDFFE